MKRMYELQIFSPKEAGEVYFLGEIVHPRSHLDKAHMSVLVIALDLVDPVNEPGPHVEHGHRPYDGHRHPGPGDGHQVSGSVMLCVE